MSLPAEVEELIASLKRQIAALQSEGADLRLRALRRRDEGGVSRGRGLAHSIWRAHQGRGDLSQYPATHSRGSDRASSERSFRRAADLPGQHRGLGSNMRDMLREANLAV